MTALEGLQTIYDKYAPRYDLLMGKLVELQNQISDDQDELKRAESQYDISLIGELTSKIESSEKVVAKLREDIKKYKDSINARPYYPDSIDKEIREVMQGAALEENKAVQDKFKEINDLHKRIREIQNELDQEKLRRMEVYRVELSRFRPLVNEPTNDRVSGWYTLINFYPEQ